MNEGGRSTLHLEEGICGIPSRVTVDKPILWVMILLIGAVECR